MVSLTAKKFNSFGPRAVRPIQRAVWPDWAIFGTLGNFLKPLATINLPKPPTFLGNFCKGVKIYLFLGKSFLGNFYRHLAIFFLVTLVAIHYLYRNADYPSYFIFQQLNNSQIWLVIALLCHERFTKWIQKYWKQILLRFYV